MWKVTHASSSCQSVEGARLPLDAIAWDKGLEVSSMPLATVAFDEVILYDALNTTFATGVGGVQ